MAYKFESIVFQSERSNLLVIHRKEIETIISAAQKEHCTAEDDLPVGICVVFGDDKNKRRLLTNSLINYYEAKANPYENRNASKYTNRQTIFIPDRMARSEGVYLWSKLYRTCTRSPKSTEDNLVLILYVEGENIKLDELAANLCSQAIILDSTEKTWLEKVLLHDGSHSNPANLIQCSELEDQAYRKLADSLEANVIPSKTYSGQFVRLTSMISVVEKTIQLLNDKATTMNHVSSDEKIDENVDQPLSNVTCHYSRARARDLKTPIKSIFQNQIVISDGSICVNENIIQEHEVDQTIAMSVTSPQTNIDLSSKTFQYTLLASLNKWLDSQISLFSLDSLVKYLKSFECIDIFNELDETWEIIGFYISDLQNMFDNYVCFYGVQDEKQLKSFSKKAYSRVSDSLKEKRLQNGQFLERILERVCIKAKELIIQENLQIIDYEIKIMKNVLKNTFNLFTDTFKSYHESLASRNQLESFKAELSTEILALFGRCTNHNGKLNHVQTEARKDLENCMTRAYSNFLKSLNDFNSNPVLQAIRIYQKSMQDIYENPQNFGQDEIHKCHNDAVQFAVNQIDTENAQQQAIKILEDPLSHIISSLNEQQQITKLLPAQLSSPSRTLCIHLNQSWIRMDAMTSKGPFTYVYWNGQLKTQPAVIALNPINYQVLYGYEAEKFIRSDTRGEFPFHGRVDDYIRNTIQREAHADMMVKGLLRSLKGSAELVFRKVFQRALIIVPSWYNLEHIMRLHKCSEEAAFLETYVAKESSMIALQILTVERAKRENSDISDLVISVGITPTGIQIEIFGRKLGDGNAVEMVGKAFNSWGNPNEKVTKQEGNYWQKFAGWIQRTAVPTTSQVLPLDSAQLLEQTFTTALAQISPVRRGPGKKYCFLLEETQEWGDILEKYINKNGNCDWVLLKNARDQFGVEMATTLSANPREIRSRTTDYLCVKEEENVLKENDEQNEKSADENEMGENEEELKIRRNKLVTQCESIKTQMQEGRVKLTNLFQKLITDTVQRAEDVGLQNDASWQELEEQEKELMELIDEYNFEIKEL